MIQIEELSILQTVINGIKKIVIAHDVDLSNDKFKILKIPVYYPYASCARDKYTHLYEFSFKEAIYHRYYDANREFELYKWLLDEYPESDMTYHGYHLKRVLVQNYYENFIEPKYYCEKLKQKEIIDIEHDIPFSLRHYYTTKSGINYQLFRTIDSFIKKVDSIVNESKILKVIE